MAENWDDDDDPSPFQFMPGEATVGLPCDRCNLPTAWSGGIHLLFGDNAPRLAKTVSGCYCCDAPIKELGNA